MSLPRPIRQPIQVSRDFDRAAQRFNKSGSFAMLTAMRQVSLYVSSVLLAAFRGAHLYHLSIIDRANSSARSRGPVTTLFAPSMPAG
jgi:hypothetical protein